jgi:hypothetical protein
LNNVKTKEAQTLAKVKLTELGYIESDYQLAYGLISEENKNDNTSKKVKKNKKRKLLELEQRITEIGKETNSLIFS